MVTTTSQAIYAWVTGHPNAVSLSIGLCSIIVFVLGAFIVSRHGSPVDKHRERNINDNEELFRLRSLERTFLAKEQWQTQCSELERTGPYLWMTHATGNDGYERLTVRNTRIKEARRVKIRDLRLAHDYICKSIPEDLAFVDRNSREDLQFKPIRITLSEALKLREFYGTCILTVEFEDDSHNSYRQQFSVEAHENGEIEFKPGDLKLQGSYASQ